MVWVNPNQPFPTETPRSALSERSYAHITHVDEEETAESAQTVAAGSNRTQELEMIATHANVRGLGLPPDLIALAYDRNNGELVDTLVYLTTPTIRRELERELAERQAEAAEQDTQERARNGLLYTMERFRRLVTPAQVEEEEEEEEVEESEGGPPPPPPKAHAKKTARRNAPRQRFEMSCTFAALELVQINMLQEMNITYPSDFKKRICDYSVAKRVITDPKKIQEEGYQSQQHATKLINLFTLSITTGEWDVGDARGCIDFLLGTANASRFIAHKLWPKEMESRPNAYNDAKFGYIHSQASKYMHAVRLLSEMHNVWSAQQQAQELTLALRHQEGEEVEVEVMEVVEEEEEEEEDGDDDDAVAKSGLGHRADANLQRELAALQDINRILKDGQVYPAWIDHKTVKTDTLECEMVRRGWAKASSYEPYLKREDKQAWLRDYCTKHQDFRRGQMPTKEFLKKRYMRARASYNRRVRAAEDE